MQTRRLTMSYMVLNLCQVIRDLGRLGPGTVFEPIGAMWQDKRTSGEFPAAHVLPCDIEIVSRPRASPALMPRHIVIAPPRRARARLYELFKNPANRTCIQLNVFGETDRVHRLTNVADRSCEAGPDGLAAVLCGACQSLVDGRGTVDSIFTTLLVSRYSEAARQRVQDLDRDMTVFRARGAYLQASCGPVWKPACRARCRHPSRVRSSSACYCQDHVETDSPNLCRHTDRLQRDPSSC
jgi:hypothetical protein